MHVYLHVPFCARRCSYCDFAIAVRRRIPSEEYVELVLREWEGWQPSAAWEGSPGIETVYFGGGTPSLLHPAAIGRILERVGRDRNIAGDAEITLEANPDDVTGAAAATWRAAGVNRVSLGTQSFDPAVLRWMHRTHTGDQVPRAVERIRAAGGFGLSLDLIFGLPPALGRDWALDLDRAFALGPEHLSLYGLTVEDHTSLQRWTKRGEVTPVDDERYAAEFLAADAALAAAGYEHYEVSNAGLPGHRARHNSAYWRRAPFIGIGPSAHSAWGAERSWNLREWKAYARAVREGRCPSAGRERLGPTEVSLEERYLGLRTIEGLPAEAVPVAHRDRWARKGWAIASAERVRLTPEGWLRLDALVASLSD